MHIMYTKVNHTSRRCISELVSGHASKALAKHAYAGDSFPVHPAGIKLTDTYSSGCADTGYRILTECRKYYQNM